MRAQADLGPVLRGQDGCRVQTVSLVEFRGTTRLRPGEESIVRGIWVDDCEGRPIGYDNTAGTPPRARVKYHGHVGRKRGGRSQTAIPTPQAACLVCLGETRSHAGGGVASMKAPWRGASGMALPRCTVLRGSRGIVESTVVVGGGGDS